MQGSDNEDAFGRRFKSPDPDDEQVKLKNASSMIGANPLIFDKSAADRMIGLQKEIKTEIFNIHSEIGGVRGEILLIRSDIAKADVLKWSIVLIIAVMSLIGLLIMVEL